MKVKGGLWVIGSFLKNNMYLCLSEGLKHNPFVSFLSSARHGKRQKYYREDWLTGEISKTHKQLAEKELTTW